MNRRPALALSASLLCAAGLMACSKADDPSANPSNGGTASTATEVCNDSRVGGSITVGSNVAPSVLDPIRGGGNGRSGAIELATIYDTLFQYDPSSGALNPRIAQGATSSADHLTWTITLRPDVTFGNGDPLTADDVQWSFQRAQSAQNVTPNLAAAKLVTGITVADSHTIEFTLSSPLPSFPYLLAGQLGMTVNRKVFESMSADAFGALPPPGAGAGAYTVEKFSPDQLVVKAKPSYWGGKACIQEITFIPQQGAAPALQGLKAKQLQLGFLSADPVNIKAARDAGFTGLSYPVDGANVVLMNSGFKTSPITTDVRVRQAVVLAIDPELYNRRVNRGAGTPSSTLLGANSPLYPGVSGVTPDPTKAKQLIDEVKADKGWDGKVDLTCPNTLANEAVELQGELEAAGFTVNMTNTIPQTQFLSRVFQGDYELACWALSITDSQPVLALQPYVSTNAGNYSGYKNADFDQAVKDLAAATTIETQKAAIGKIQTTWNSDPPIAIFVQSENFIAAASNVKGLVPTAQWIVLLSEAYLS